MYMPVSAGEEPATGIIASIIPGSPTIITCVDDERMDFQVRSCICLRAVGSWYVVHSGSAGHTACDRLQDG